MATLQVRSLDDNLYKALRLRASMDNRSISQEVIAIIKAHLSESQTSHQNATHAFLEMCGTWSDERNAEEIAIEIRQARRTNNRFQEIF